MCEQVHHIERDIHEPISDYVERCRARGEEFPCRMCEECARSAGGRIVGDFVAQKQVSQRCLVVLLTYDDEKLLAAGRPVTDRDSIPICKEDARLFVHNARKMLRRMHPDLKVEMLAYRITEMRQLVELVKDSKGKPKLDWAGRQVVTKPFLQTPPRAHHHICLWLSVKWKDHVLMDRGPFKGEKRQDHQPARWRDDLIPRLRTDEWLYNHVWETKAEAKARGGRVRKLAIPWPWGYSSYGEPRGGEGAYFAKYISKAMRLRMKYKEDRYREWSEDELLDFQRSEESWKSCRKSPGLGKGFYNQQGIRQAEAGLPPRLTFQCGLDVIEGGLYPRKFLAGEELGFDDMGKLVVTKKWSKKPPNFMLQRTGRQRALLSAYDRRRAELYGEAEEPKGPNYRRKIMADGRERMVIVYGLDEAREAIAKDDDRRFIAKRERQLGRRRREVSRERVTRDGVEFSRTLRGDLDRLSGKLSDELAASLPRGNEKPAELAALRPRPLVKVEGRLNWRNTYWPGRDFRGLVDCWGAEFRREVVPEVGHNPTSGDVDELYRSYLYTWLRHQVGLARFSSEQVTRLRNAIVRERLNPVPNHDGQLYWPAWRKGRMKAGTICG